MPYIGNQHNVGDHVNNFKVLDDISSYTATFDGSATSVVDTTNNTIRVPEHRFIQGQRVTYTNGGGGNIGGLTTGTAYFVSFDTANTIKLATTLVNANNNTVINLSAVGSGTSHTLNAAFDGVNTKFKMTHGSGKSARLNNATQLNVAINNVIQRPNLDPNNFTDGFAIEDNHKIVFKTAPTVNDVFWGSIIANTIENFDLRDNEVDNFTGDGSTTEFTLSTIPANNESVVVSINGVVQHPSDKNTARSYTLIDSIIQFTAAPALGDGIQVRHIGFAGASTNDVSGFYGRTGNVALTSSDHITTGDITSRNINASGIVTASTFDGSFTGNVVGTSATFTGNLTVGGVLTYEDVTNVDSVGLITARDGIFLPDSKKAMFGNTAADPDLEIYHGGTASYISHSGTGNLFIHSDTVALRKQNQQAYFVGVNGQSKLYESGSERLVTTDKGITVGTGVTIETNGQATFVGIVTFGSGSTTIDNNVVNVGTALTLGHTQGVQFHTQNLHSRGFEVNQINASGIITASSFRGPTGGTATFQDIDVDGHTNLDNVSIAGVTTFASGNVKLASDSQRLQLGSGQDLWMYHTGTSGGGHGLIQNEYGTMYMLSPSWEYRHYGTNQTTFKINANNSVSLYYQNSAKLSTTSTGAQIDTILRLYGAAGSGGGRLRLAEGAAYSEIRGVRNTDTSSELWFGTEISDTVDYRAKINTGGHFIPGTDSTYDLGLTGTRWRNLYADTLYGDGSNLTGITQTTINSNTDHYLITATGTANTLQGESGLQWNGTSLTLEKSTNAYLNPDLNVYNSYNGGWGGSITFSGKTGGSKYSQARIRVYGGSNSSDGSLAIETGNMGEKFRISSAGKVLIGDGTSITPSRHLDVRGTGHQQILIGSTNNAGASLMVDGHGGGDGSGGNYGTFEMASDGHLNIRNYDAAKNMVFGVGSNTGAEDTLILTSDGDLGLSNTGTNNPNNYNNWCTFTINGTAGAELDFEKAGTLHGDIYANATRFAMTTRDSSTDIFFATKNNAGTTADRLQITSEGSIQHVNGSGVSYFNGASEYVFGSTGSSPASGGAEGNVQIHAHKTRAQFSINGYMNNAGGPYMQLVSSRSGTVGTLGAAAANNDGLGAIRFSADDGNGGVVYGAEIAGKAKSAATTNGIAGRLEFFTAKDASSTVRQVFSMNEGGGLTAESESPALYGYYTSVNNGNKYVDFPQWTRDSFICLEIFGNINPNSAGSGAYLDPVHMYVYRGVGWTGSRLGYYIYCVSVAPPARHAFPSGTGYSGNAQISAVWTDGSSVIGNETATSTHYMRLQIPNANTTYSFPKQFRIFRRR